MLLPIKTKNPPESVPYVTFGLIGVNIVIFLMTSNLIEIREEVVKQFALTHANVGPLTLFSSMFLHGDLMHLLGNMWFLWLMGAAVEGRLRSFKFIVLYLLAGLAGDGLHLLMTMNQPDIPSLGASGAITGLMGAALWMFPFSKVVIFYWFGIWWHGTWEWRMWGVGLFYLGFDLIEQIAFGQFSGVAHFAHLGGALGGVLVALAFRTKRDDPVVSDAKSDLSEVNDLRILTKYDLAKLAEVQPENSEVALAWMSRSLDHGNRPPPEAVQHFQRHLKHLTREGDVDQLGVAMVHLSEQDGVVTAQSLFEVGVRLEKEGRPQMAIPLLERCFREKTCNDSIAESAAYRLGMIHEAWFQNFAKALEWFEYHQQKWPMSAFEAQVRERIKFLKTKV